MQYAPVKIKNPITANHLVRLLPLQKLIVILTNPELQQAQIYINSNFVKLEREDSIDYGRRFIFCQVGDLTQFRNSSDFFLGEIIVKAPGAFDASLSLLINSPGNDGFVRTINPNGQQCRLEPYQVLDVIYILDHSPLLDCIITASNNFKMEQLDYRIRVVDKVFRMSLIENGFHLGQDAEEHKFRFRYDSASIEILQNLPHGKYDAGQLFFYERGSEVHGFNAIVNILLNWKNNKKHEIYKALLLPRASYYPLRQQLRRKNRQPMTSQVSIIPMECTDLESGCNIIFSKCY